jgi:hypothetical protein
MPRDGNYGPESQTPTGDYQLTCQNCHQPFRTDDERQLYCSPRCKRSAQNKRHYLAHKNRIENRRKTT